MQGIAASAGSACTTGNSEPSHVLLAMGLSPEQARASLRLTVGRSNTVEQIDETVEILAETVRVTAEAALQQWLGHLIELVSLNLEAEDNRLIVEVVFTLRNQTEPQHVKFERAL